MRRTAHPDLALIGRAGTGKDTAADYLVERYGYTRLAFADPLRELAAFVNPLVDPHVGHYADALEEFGYRNAKDRLPEIRRFLDRLGRGVREVLGDATWTSALAKKLDALDPTTPVVVTDVRFPNEVALLADDYGFRPLRLTRASAPIVDAPSEVALDDYVAPFAFDNSGDLPALHAFLDGFVETYRRDLT